MHNYIWCTLELMHKGWYFGFITHEINNIYSSRYATSRQCRNRCFTCLWNLSPMHMTCVGNVDSAANGVKIVCEATIASMAVLAQTLKHGMLGVRWTSDHYCHGYPYPQRSLFFSSDKFRPCKARNMSQGFIFVCVHISDISGITDILTYITNF